MLAWLDLIRAKWNDGFNRCDRVITSPYLHLRGVRGDYVYSLKNGIPVVCAFSIWELFPGTQDMEVIRIDCSSLDILGWGSKRIEWSVAHGELFAKNSDSSGWSSVYIALNNWIKNHGLVVMVFFVHWTVVLVVWFLVIRVFIVHRRLNRCIMLIVKILEIVKIEEKQILCLKDRVNKFHPTECKECEYCKK